VVAEAEKSFCDAGFRQFGSGAHGKIAPLFEQQQLLSLAWTQRPRNA
jgi:hypothetical protein